MDVADPSRAVVVDYGFMNCRDAHQRTQLREIYHEYFKKGKDEMKLHEACVIGGLGGFLGSALGSLTVSRDLLRNPYPMENFPLVGMVTQSDLMCPESGLELVNASGSSDSM